jgi:hypothetical protein
MRCYDGEYRVINFKYMNKEKTVEHIYNLQPSVRQMFRMARDYFDYMWQETEKRTYSIMADEYRAGLNGVDTLVDFWGRFTSHEALVVVKQSLHRFHDELLPEYQLLDQQLTRLFCEIERVEPSYRVPGIEVEPITPIKAAGRGSQ